MIMKFPPNKELSAPNDRKYSYKKKIFGQFSDRKLGGGICPAPSSTLSATIDAAGNNSLEFAGIAANM